MLLFKNSLALIITFVLTFSLHAEDSLVITNHAPPYVINVGDTSTSVLPAFKNHKKPASKPESIQDTSLSNCDILFLQSGKMVYCKIISTTSTTVTYKMCDRPEGLTTATNKSLIHKIKYANGKEEIVNERRKGKPYKPRDVWAVVSLVIGILSIATVLLFGFIFIGLALTGFIIGIISFFTIKKSRKTDDELKGSGSALLGILLNGLAIALVILSFI